MRWLARGGGQPRCGSERPRPRLVALRNLFTPYKAVSSCRKYSEGGGTEMSSRKLCELVINTKYGARTVCRSLDGSLSWLRRAHGRRARPGRRWSRPQSRRACASGRLQPGSVTKKGGQ